MRMTVPGVMPNQALPPEMNTVTTDMITTVMAAVVMPGERGRTRFESRATTSRFAVSKRRRS